MQAVLDRLTNLPRRLPAAAVLAWLALALLPPAWGADPPRDERPGYSLGYTSHRTNLEGYFANRVTARAFVVKGDGSGTTELAPELASKSNQYTQFGGWSPDGRQAILSQNWQDPENGAWEDKHGRWRFSAEHWLSDLILLDMESMKTTN